MGENYQRGDGDVRCYLVIMTDRCSLDGGIRTQAPDTGGINMISSQSSSLNITQYQRSKQEMNTFKPSITLSSLCQQPRYQALGTKSQGTVLYNPVTTVYWRFFIRNSAGTGTICEGEDCLKSQFVTRNISAYFLGENNCKTHMCLFYCTIIIEVRLFMDVYSTWHLPD